MTVMEFLNSDAMRWINVGLACCVVTLLIAGAMARWEIMPLRFKRITPWVIFTYVVIAYGSAEVALNPSPATFGYRVTLMALTLCGLIIALLYGIRDDHYDA